MKNQCKDCEDRHMGCHVECEKYAEYRKWIDDRKAEIQEEKTKEALLRKRRKTR